MKDRNIELISPILSFSGYGEQSRYIYQLLMSGKNSIGCQALNWGETSWIFEDNQLRRDIDFSFFNSDRRTSQLPDMNIQVCGPLEVTKTQGKNILYTAGIETDICMKEWRPALEYFDLILVPSVHAKKSIALTEEIESKTRLLPFSARTVKPEPFEFNLPTSKNFISVSTITTRKNVDFLIESFIKEFKDEEVGLILKLTGKGLSYLDFERCKNYINAFKRKFEDVKCKIYLLNGYLTEGQMRTILRRQDVLGYVSPTHGEGFGLPMFEAVSEYNKVIATDWSGHLDYLKDYSLYYPVEYDLRQVENKDCMRGYIHRDQKWAYPREESLRSAMRTVFEEGYYQKHQFLGTERSFEHEMFENRFLFEENRKNLERYLDEIE